MHPKRRRPLAIRRLARGFEAGSDSCQLPEHTPPYRRGCRKRYSGRTARALTTKGGSGHGELQGHIIGQSRV